MVTLGKADLILVNGQFHTVDRENPLAEAVAVRDGKFPEVGTVAEVMQHHCDGTKMVDLKGHTAIPGLNDSHLHLIRGGLNYNLELRWEGVPSPADALRMLKEQALRTPSPQWVRVVGGWSEFQFAERRMPTLDEINDAAPDTPVFILHLYDRALLNRAALKVVGYTRGHAESAGRGDPARRQRQPDRDADRPPERHDPVLNPRQRAEAAAGAAGQLHAPVHARAEPPGADQRHRRRRRLPELPGRLRGNCRAAREKADDHPHRLQPVYPASGLRAGRL